MNHSFPQAALNPYKQHLTVQQMTNKQHLTVQQITEKPQMPVQQKNVENSKQVQDRLKSLLPGLDIKQAGVTIRREKEVEVVDDEDSINTDDKSEYDSDDDDIIRDDDIRENKSKRGVENTNQEDEYLYDEEEGKEELVGGEE